MNTRRVYPRTFEQAFKSLTLDGRTLSPFEAYQHFTKLSDKRRKDETWKEDLSALIVQLAMQAGKALPAFTSGTTGPPKLIRIPRRDLVRSARLTADAFGLNEGDRALLCLPCTYIAGKMMVVRAMALGLDLHVIDPRGSVLDNLMVRDAFRFTAMVPLQLHRAIQEDRKRVEAQFHTILLGGGPVSQALEEDLQGLRTSVFQGYGSTETVTHVALRRVNGPGRSERYHAIGDVSFSTDHRGCLVVNTPHLARKQQVTNDLVDLKDATQFRWRGRADHVILSGGKKIYPEELESRTAGLIPYAHFFTAVPDDRLGQAVALVLETEEPAERVVDDVVQSLIKVLGMHEMPRRVTAMRTFKRTTSGKVVRTLLP
ncbi:MAG: AMP-binding protein [Flavobacteriales bacterium]|nr:AMP-binding protein [Flavobacteriales bacterium]MBP9079123.1 AMP-binding protein [Flavobacteriales bacterium]